MTIRRLVLAGLAMIAACSRQVPRADGPNVVTITTSEYAFGMPDTIPAGLTTFRLVNQGKELLALAQSLNFYLDGTALCLRQVLE